MDQGAYNRPMRKLLMTTIIGGAIAMGGSGAAPGAAPMQPMGGWAISRIPASQNGGAYCAMARKFGDNLVITFARNEKNEISVAVDFQKPVLNTDQEYLTILKPGFSQDRAFTVRPVSQKALVIRMGEDQDFFTALTRSDRLDLDLGGEQFGFVMPDMAGGLRDVNHCIVAMSGANPAIPASRTAQLDVATIEPAAGEPATGEPASGKPAMMQSVSSEVLPMPGESATMRAMPAAQSMALKTDAPPRRATIAASAPASAPVPQGGAQADATASLALQLRSLREENERLKTSLAEQRQSATPKAAPADDPRVASLTQRADALAAENDALRNQLADASARAATAKAAPAPDPALTGQVASMRARNESLTQQVASLQGQLEQQRKAPAPQADDGQKVAQLEATIAKLQSENSALSSSLTAMKSASGDAGTVSLAQLRATEARLGAVEKDRDALVAQVAQMRDGKAQGLMSIAGNDWTLKTATGRYTEAEREIQRLGRQMENERTSCMAEKKELEYTLFDPRIAQKAQIAKLVELEDQLASAKASKSAQQDQAKLAEKDARIAELERMAAASQSELASLRAQLDQARHAAAELPSRQDGTGRADKVAGNDLSEGFKAQLAERDRKLAETEAQLTMLRNQLSTPAEPAASAPVMAPVDKVAEADMPAAAVDFAAIQTASGTVSDDPQPAMSFFNVNRRRDRGGEISRAAAVAVAPVNPRMPTTSPKISGIDTMRTVLSDAGIDLTRNVQDASDALGDLGAAYTWESAGMYGSAEQYPLGEPAQFQALVTAYLDKTRERCDGQFAVSPGATVDRPGLRTAAYEIACVAGHSQGSAASLLFVARDGQFTSIAHEGSLDSMARGMDLRDRVASSIGGQKVASR